MGKSKTHDPADIELRVGPPEADGNGASKGRENLFHKAAIATAEGDYMAPGELLPNLATGTDVGPVTREAARAMMATLVAVPEAIEDVERAIEQAGWVGRRAALRQACLISAARGRFFDGDRERWMTWVKDRMGFSERHADRCLAIGRFVDSVLAPSLMLTSGPVDEEVKPKVTYTLAPATVERVLTLDLDKMEMVAAIPADKVSDFFSDNPHAEALENRKFRAAARGWKLLTEAQRKKVKERELKREEKKAALDTAEGKFDALVATLITKAPILAPLAVGKLDARQALQGAKELLTAAMNTLEMKPKLLTATAWDEVVANLEDTLEFARTIRDGRK